MIFNVYGSCVSRDIFRFSNTHSVDINIQRNPISVAMSPAINVTPEIENSLEKFLNYEKRVMLYDFRKQALDLILNSKTEWLIIDVTEERWGSLCIATNKNNPNNTTKLYWPAPRKEYNEIQKHILEKTNYSYRTLTIDDLDYNEIEQAYKQVAEKILKVYDSSKVIICESYYSEYLLKNDGTLEKFENRVKDLYKMNNHYKRIHEILFKCFPKSPIIKFPTNTLGSENHLWPWSPLHYTDDYYLYASEAIDIITKQKLTHTLEQLYNEQCLKNLLLIQNIKTQESYSKLQQINTDLQSKLNQTQAEIINLKLEINKIKDKLELSKK